MNEASMPQLVLAVATKKAMKAMLHEESGETGALLRKLCTIVGGCCASQIHCPVVHLGLVGSPAVKHLMGEGRADVRKLARKMEVSRDRIASWPSDKLVIHAEHSSVFYDLMPEHIQEQVPCGISHLPVLLVSAVQAVCLLEPHKTAHLCEI